MNLALVKIIPWRGPEYLDWIRTLPCAVCGTTRGVEAAHTGSHGMRSKAPDYRAIPLCAAHHRERPDSHHAFGGNSQKFGDVHNIDVNELVLKLIAIWISLGNSIGG